MWDLSSAGRASALQAEGHRFEPCRSHICRRGGTGRRTGLKILRDLYSRIGSIPIAGIMIYLVGEDSHFHKWESSPTSIKASGGLQRCALEICHANA